MATHPREQGRNRRRLAIAVVAVATAILVPSVASAHVTVHPDHLVPGQTDVLLTFRCPNERSDSSTVELQIYLPLATPLLGVLTSPPQGWTATAKTVTLRTPVRTDDGVISQAVSEVTWRATGRGIPPGQFKDFDLAVGALPNVAGPLVFKALQTYSNGEVVRWIQVSDAAVPVPDNPAPVLTLGGASPTSAPASSNGILLATVALVCAVLALAGVCLLLLRRRRRW